MTTIVAVPTPKGIRFAWDTQTTAGNRAKIGDDKVFRNGSVVFGVAGYKRTSNILQYMSVPDQDTHKKDYDTRKWIVTKLIPAVLKAVKDAGAGSTDSDKSYINGHVIVAVDDVVGYLGDDLSFVEDELGAYAIGSGSEFALGALVAGVSPKDSVKVAAALDLYTGGDVRTLKVKKVSYGTKKGNK